MPDSPADRSAQVQAFWQDKARHGADPATLTHRDLHQRQLEVWALQQELGHAGRLLDVGCGNGYSTVAMVDQCDSVLAVDYLAEMVGRAGQEHPHPKVTYQRADVLNWDLPPASFDTVVSERCLINITDWDDQKRALGHIAAVLRPGGRYLMLETFVAGRAAINAQRQSLGLPAMPPVFHNLDFDESALPAAMAPWFHLEHVRRFGLYEFLTRLALPLMVGAEQAQYGSPMHAAALALCQQVSAFDELSKTGLMVWRRHDG